MKKDLQEILSKLRKLRPYITQKYYVNSTEVFGSYVKNQQTDTSDLDVLISYSKTPGLLKFLELKYYLTDNLNVNVDLVLKDSLKPEIRQHILNESIKF